MPFFRRKYTSQEVKDCQIEMQKMTNQWYNGVTLIPTSDQSESEEEEEEEEEIEVGNPHQNDDRNGNHDIEETKA